MAHEACRATVEEFLKIGGEYRQMPVTAPEHLGGKRDQVKLEDGTGIASDYFIFAWLGKLFPDVIGDHIRPTRQEVYYITFEFPREKSGFQKERFRSGLIIRLVWYTAFPQPMGEDSRSPTTREVRSSIRRMATER